MLRAPAGEQQRLDFARPVDNPRQPRCADIEECADAAQQENGSDRQPHDLCDRRDGEVGGGFEHAPLWTAGANQFQRQLPKGGFQASTASMMMTPRMVTMAARL